MAIILSGNRKTLGASQTLYFKITAAAAVEMVVLFGMRDESGVLEAFAYPANREADEELGVSEWRELYKDEAGGFFYATLSEAATRAVEEGLLVVDVKGWDSSDNNELKRGVLTYIKPTYASKIGRRE